MLSNIFWRKSGFSGHFSQEGSFLSGVLIVLRRILRGRGGFVHLLFLVSLPMAGMACALRHHRYLKQPRLIVIELWQWDTWENYSYNNILKISVRPSRKNAVTCNIVMHISIIYCVLNSTVHQDRATNCQICLAFRFGRATAVATRGDKKHCVSNYSILSIGS